MIEIGQKTTIIYAVGQLSRQPILTVTNPAGLLIPEDIHSEALIRTDRSLTYWVNCWSMFFDRLSLVHQYPMIVSVQPVSLNTGTPYVSRRDDTTRYFMVTFYTERGEKILVHAPARQYVWEDFQILGLDNYLRNWLSGSTSYYSVSGINDSLVYIMKAVADAL